MADHLMWRRRLGAGVCKSYSMSSNVAATAIGGSVARGWADEFSDVEVLIFWREAPTDAERIAAVDRSGGRIDVVWSDAAAMERWGAAMDATDGRVGEMWPYEDGEWSEHYYVDGVNIGVSGFLVSTADSWFDDLVRGVASDDAEMLAATVIARGQITGQELLETWAKRLDPYPNALRSAVITKWLQVDERWWSVDQLARRDDRPAYDSVVVAMQRRLLRLLLAVNDRYLTDPKPKWTRELLAAMEVLPTDCAKRFELIQTSRPREAAIQLQALFDDTLDLMAIQLGGMDIDEARLRFRHRRAVWTRPPQSMR